VTPRKMRWQLVIFDCDGVLVDSEPVSNRIFADALQEIGLPMDYEQVCREFIGLSMASCVHIIEERLERPVPAGFVDRLQARTFAAFERELHPVAGVAAALDRIDVPVCVASSGEHEKMRLTLGLTGLLQRFEGRLFSATEVERGKPFPDLFLHVARRMRAEPAYCAVIEDSVHGVHAACAAEMAAFGYATPERAQALSDAGARVFGDMQELPALLRGA